MKALNPGSLFFFAILIIVPLGYSSSIQESAHLPKYLLLSISLLIALFFCYKEVSKNQIKISLSHLLLIAYFFFSLPGIVNAINPSEALFETSKMVLFVGTYFLSSHFLQKSKKSLEKPIAIFASLAILFVLIFIVKELNQALLDRNPFSSTVYLIKGLNGHKNLVASWLLLLLPLSLIGLALNKIKDGKKFIVAAAIALVLLLMLQSRASLTGLFIGGIIYFFIQSKWAKNKIKPFLYELIGLTAILIILILLSPAFESLLSNTSLESASAKERLILWEKTIGIIKENPIWGVGGGNWKILFPSQNLTGLYRAELNDVVFIRPHNDLLWIWAEHGLLSLIAFLGLLFTLLMHGADKIITRQAHWRVTSITFAAVFAYLAMAFFDFPKERMEHQVGLAIILALLAKDTKEKIIIDLEPLWSKMILFLGMLSFAFFIFLGFQRYTAETHIKKLLEYKELGNQALLLEEAKKVNQNYVQIDNNAMPIDWYMGNALFNLSWQNEAVEKYLTAVELNPYNFNILNNAGVAYFIKNNYQEATKYFIEALRINPKHDDSRLNLAAAYINLSQFNLALEQLNQLRVKSQRSEDLRKMINNSKLN